jgi:hypothetical protein
MREAITSPVTGIIIGLLATSGCEAAYADRSDVPAVDPKADTLLRKMSTTLAATQSFQVDTDHILEQVTAAGEKHQFVAQSRVVVQRPNKLRSDRVGAFADGTLYYDGDSLTIYGKRARLYASAPAPETLDATIDFARETLGLEAPAADLLYSDAYRVLMEDVVSGTYLGNEPIGNRMCHHLAYRGHETDWQIWIEDGPRALPCRYLIISKKLDGAPEFAVALDNWNLAPKVSASQFQFTPEPGDTEIEFLGLQQDTQQGVQQHIQQGKQP